MIGEKNGGDKFRVRTCPRCGKEIILTYEMTRGNGYVWGRPGLGASYLCSWRCYRLFKYDRIMEKTKLTADDVTWLRFARFPIPEEKLPKWMKE